MATSKNAVREVMPYLMRRLDENSSISSQGKLNSVEIACEKLKETGLLVLWKRKGTMDY